jgi:CBS domain-containing protein
MRKLVRDAMTVNPRTIGMHQSVRDAAQIMAAEDIGSIPVVDQDEILAGIVTDRDIALRVVAEGRDPETTRVYEVATTHVSPAYPEEPLDEALDQMAHHRVRRLPVIRDDRVVGILAQADIVHEVNDKKAGQLVEEISQPLN